MLTLARARPRAAFALLAVAVLAACVLFWRTPGDTALYPPRSSEPAVTIYVVDNGFHTDLVAPREALAAHGGPTARALSSIAPGPFVAIGWGDRRFYVEHGLSLHRALDAVRAAFWPANVSAVKLAPLPRAPDRIWKSGVHPLRLSVAGFERLEQRLDKSFALEAGAPSALATPSEDGGRFFASRERFGLLHLCNHWTAQLLGAAGLSMRPLLDVLPAGVILDLETDGAVGHRRG